MAPSLQLSSIRDGPTCRTSVHALSCPLSTLPHALGISQLEQCSEQTEELALFGEMKEEERM